MEATQKSAEVPTGNLLVYRTGAQHSQMVHPFVNVASGFLLVSLSVSTVLPTKSDAFLHVLPKGFVRIRYFGFLANRFRAHCLPLCQQLLAGQSMARCNASLVCRFR